MENIYKVTVHCLSSPYCKSKSHVKRKDLSFYSQIKIISFNNQLK